MVIFTPDNEPYLGRQAVFHFDQMITILIAQQVRVAPLTRGAGCAPLQRAAGELVPSGCSIALSIRELIRQGYLLSANVLFRPLFERVATLSYLIENPDAVPLWAAGWPHGKRPALKDRIEAMHSVAGSEQVDKAEFDGAAVRSLLNELNSLVHGDPAAPLFGAVLMEDGTPGFTVGKDLGSPSRADEIAWNTTMLVVILAARTVQLFPGNSDGASPPETVA